MIDSTNPRQLADNIRNIEKQAGGIASRVTALEVTAPKDYSTTETATGQKWIDGKEIYCKVEKGKLPVIASTGIHDVLDYSNKAIISVDGFITSGTGNNTFLNAYTGAGALTLIQKATGEISIYSPAAYSENDYTFIIYYTKSDPVPGDAKGPEEPEPEPEEKKTTKKKTTTK